MISIMYKSVLRDHQGIFDAPGSIRTAHIFNDRVLFLYEHYELIPGDRRKLLRDTPVSGADNLRDVNRNILMIDFAGAVLWRIESKADHYCPWTVVGAQPETSNEWYACMIDGYEYKLDISNGVVSDGLFMR